MSTLEADQRAIALANAVKEVKEDTEQLERSVAKVLKPAVQRFQASLYQPGRRGAFRTVMQELLGVDQVGTTGTTALVMVCTRGNVDEARALVEVGGADMNLGALEFTENIQEADVGKDVAVWKRPRTPHGKVAVAKYPLEKGADPNKTAADNGPLNIAKRLNHIEFAEVLLKKGANSKMDLHRQHA